MIVSLVSFETTLLRIETILVESRDFVQSTESVEIARREEKQSTKSPKEALFTGNMETMR